MDLICSTVKLTILILSLLWLLKNEVTARYKAEDSWLYQLDNVERLCSLRRCLT